MFWLFVQFDWTKKSALPQKTDTETDSVSVLPYSLFQKNLRPLTAAGI